jgi:hypothetical protein
MGVLFFICLLFNEQASWCRLLSFMVLILSDYVLHQAKILPMVGVVTIVVNLRNIDLNFLIETEAPLGQIL